ncbi:MAG: PAP/fibrillin family protein [Halothece sp.]
MVEVRDRLSIKQKLLEEIERLGKEPNTVTPITDLDIPSQSVSAITAITEELEALNPFPQPLLSAKNLLNGAWLLQYSTAREIRSLKRLPLGFQVGRIYQTIDVNQASFENRAWVEHRWGGLLGYVRVTATFEPAKEAEGQLSDQRINVNFQQRFLGIQRILGIQTNWLDPMRAVEAKNPVGRIPSLKITYIDETMRIGRGGDESLFILTRE